MFRQRGKKGWGDTSAFPFHSFSPSFLFQPGSVDNIQGNVCLGLPETPQKIPRGWNDTNPPILVISTLIINKVLSRNFFQKGISSSFNLWALVPNAPGLDCLIKRKLQTTPSSPCGIPGAFQGMLSNLDSGIVLPMAGAGTG